eukprot:169346-Chlamydomonas_euryale.AAC.3
MAPTGAARHLYPPPGWHSTKLSMLSARTSRAVCPAGRAITAVARPLPPARRPTRDASAMAGQLDKSTPEAQWKTILDATQFKVLRQKGTVSTAVHLIGGRPARASRRGGADGGARVW